MIGLLVKLSLAILRNPLLQLVTLVVLLFWGAYYVYRRYARVQRRKKYENEVVILHQLPPGLRAPTASPFVLKLETWLKMARIKYQNEFNHEYGPKGKVPWITLNGVEMGDSQFIIEHLSKRYDINFSRNHSREQNAVARAFMKMAEQSLYWVMNLHRFVFNPEPSHSGTSYLLHNVHRRTTQKNAKAQGYGLHTEIEVNSIAKADLDSLNDFIGSKKFLLGNQVCDEDAAIFGILAQIVDHDRTVLHQHLTGQCPNLVRYVETIKQAYWPDWNERARSARA